MELSEIPLRPGELKLSQLRQIHAGPSALALAPEAWREIRKSRAAVEQALESGEAHYGINTGFGRLAQTRVEDRDLGQLQRNLVLSHATGVGPSLGAGVVRLILAMKVNALSRGYSGVRPEVVEMLSALLRANALPLIPEQGSVGASGDLAPLAHLSVALLGVGQIDIDGEVAPARVALDKLGLAPLELQAKEGLALLNGTQVSTALALEGLFEAERNLSAALVSGAMTVDAVLGSIAPFDQRIHDLRGHPGQRYCARAYRELLAGSQINASHADCDRVQDPYSLRCQPQVMGACLEQLHHAARVLEREANAVTDNPLVMSEGPEILSGGNFHAEPVALAADNMALAIAEIGALSERRMALLIDAQLSQLPAFLVRDPGLHSGFMIAHVTAAALASENKSLAHPASVDSLPTSANQEDHVSMATFAARRLRQMNANTQRIIAIELLGAAQGIDLRRPLQSSEALEALHLRIRQEVEPWDADRFFAPDLDAAHRIVGAGDLGNLARPFIEAREPHAAL